MNLTDEQWRLIEPILPPPFPSGRGRPPLDRRRSLSGIGFRMPTNKKALVLVAILFSVYLVVRLVIPPLLGAALTFNWQSFLS